MTDESPDAAYEATRRSKQDRTAFAMRLSRYMDRVAVYAQQWGDRASIDGFQAVVYCGTPKHSVESSHA